MSFSIQKRRLTALGTGLAVICGISFPGSSGLAPQAAFAAQEAHAQEAHKDLNVEAAQAPVSKPGPVASAGRRKPVVVSLVPVGPPVLKIGVPVGFRLTSTASGYAHLYVLDPSGKTQIWLENVKIARDRPLAYPPAGFTVRAAPPAGDETVIFAVSRRPINGFAGRRVTTKPFDAQIAPAAFHDALEQKLSALPARDWVSTQTQLRVED